ncbi:MAG: DUF4339 domain-containing protein [Deltaproteobacteria bacterium]|nr:DUF4339 domain-containing protein [Deltaproteobacteria bacterium]
MDLWPNQDNEVHENPSWQSMQPAEQAAIHRWFVENDGSYIGPVEISEVERLWQTTEINEQTRVWTEGMVDWQNIADVPELMYLTVTPTTTQKNNTVSAPQSWKSLEVSSLANLVDTELDSIFVKDQQQLPEHQVADDLPVIEAVGARDPFGNWWSERPIPQDTTRRQSHRITRWFTDPWHIKIKGQRDIRRLYWLLGVTATLTVIASSTLALNAMGIIAIGRCVPETALASSNEIMPLAAVLPSTNTASMVGVSSNAGLANTAKANSSALSGVAASASAVGAKEVVKTSNEEKEVKTNNQQNNKLVNSINNKSEPATKHVSKKRSRSINKDISGRQANKDPLTPKEVLIATKNQVRSLAPCLKQARKNGELEAKRYNFVLDWQIKANGRVAGARLKSPAEILPTTIASCFKTAMRQWHYRASGEDFAVSNFPIPVNVR